MVSIYYREWTMTIKIGTEYNKNTSTKTDPHAKLSLVWSKRRYVLLSGNHFRCQTNLQTDRDRLETIMFGEIDQKMKTSQPIKCYLQSRSDLILNLKENNKNIITITRTGAIVHKKDIKRFDEQKTRSFETIMERNRFYLTPMTYPHHASIELCQFLHGSVVTLSYNECRSK